MGIEDITLPDGRVWIHQIGNIPRPNLRIRNIKLGKDIYKILESYKLASDNYCITVQKDWSKNGIGFRVTYQEGKYLEGVCLKDGKIVRVESYLIDREFTPKKPLSKMNDNEVKECLDHWFAPLINTPEPQYIKIKEFESELCFLPWRVELDAIFKGGGYFSKR